MTRRLLPLLLLLAGEVLAAQAATVRPGDTLYRVSVRTGVTVAHLQQWNALQGTTIHAGQTLRLTHVTVRTRPSSLSGRVLGWLADARVQALLAKQATFDLTPELQSARAAVQARLPYRVANGVTLSGQVDRLALRSVSVEPQGVVAVTRAEGELDAHVDLR